MTDEIYTANVNVKIEDLKIKREILDEAVAALFEDMAAWYRQKSRIIEVLETAGFDVSEDEDEYSTDIIVSFGKHEKHCRDWAAAIKEIIDASRGDAF